MLRVILDWGGRRWVLDDQTVRVVESVSLFDLSPVVPTRSLTMTLALGDVVAHCRTHHPRTARVQIVTEDDRYVFTGLVDAIIPGRAGEASEVRAGVTLDVESSKIPATYDVKVRFINWKAVNRKDAKNEEYLRLGMDELYRTHQFRPITLNDTNWYLLQIDRSLVYGLRYEGRVAARVYGQPGRSGIAATQAWILDASNDILAIAGHACKTGTVTVVGPKSGALDRLEKDSASAVLTVDNGGRTITTVDVSGLTGIANPSGGSGSDEKDWFIRWDGTASGLPNHPVDIMLDLLAHMSGLDVDIASFESARSALDGYVLDGVIDAETSAEAVLMQQILPLLPVRLTWAPNGIGLTVIDWTPDPLRSTCTLVAGVDCSPVSRVRHASADGFEVINAWTVRYSASKRSRGFVSAVTVGPARQADAAESLSMHGIRAGTLETSWVYSAATAGLIAQHRIATTAKDRLIVDVAVPSAVYGFGGVRELRLGDVITYTDDDEALSGVLAMVGSIERDGSDVDVLGLVVL